MGQGKCFSNSNKTNLWRLALSLLNGRTANSRQPAVASKHALATNALFDSGICTWSMERLP
jgi:hypothetical protein